MRETHKTCKGCGEHKPLAEFYADKTTKDGLRGKCKSCMNAYVKQWRKESPEKWRKIQVVYMERHRENSKRSRHKTGRYRDYTKVYSATHPLENKARRKASYAIETGVLWREPCAYCGSDMNVDAHHPDYAKPLDVVWLCRPCHTVEHINARNTYRE